MAKSMMGRDVMPLRITSSRMPDLDVEVESLAGELVAGFKYSRLFAHQLPSGLYVSARMQPAPDDERQRPTSKMPSQDLAALLEEQGRAGKLHRAHTVDREDLTTTKRVPSSRHGSSSRPRRQRRMFVAFDPRTGMSEVEAPRPVVAPRAEDAELPELVPGSDARIAC